MACRFSESLAILDMVSSSLAQQELKIEEVPHVKDLFVWQAWL